MSRLKSLKLALLQGIILQNSLKLCGIVPIRGIYFSKTPFIFDTPDFDVRCIDEATYWDLYNNSTKNKVTKGILFSFIAAAMYLLYWTGNNNAGCV